jgi:hypothetical protein
MAKTISEATGIVMDIKNEMRSFRKETRKRPETRFGFQQATKEQARAYMNELLPQEKLAFIESIRAGKR